MFAIVNTAHNFLLFLFRDRRNISDIFRFTGFMSIKRVIRMLSKLFKFIVRYALLNGIYLKVYIISQCHAKLLYNVDTLFAI